MVSTWLKIVSNGDTFIDRFASMIKNVAGFIYAGLYSNLSTDNYISELTSYKLWLVGFSFTSNMIISWLIIYIYIQNFVYFIT